jgi:methylenetetrahydrofolate reductase (NADPH)
MNEAGIGNHPTFKRGPGPSQDPHVSFEFFPPKNPKGWDQLKNAAARLAVFDPDFVSVTFGAGGSVRERTYETCVTLKNDLGLDVAPHLSCLGLTREHLEKHLETYKREGFDRVLALRGDVPLDLNSASEVPYYEGGFRYANELVSFIKKRGGFHILVACYPEGHPEAPSLQTDIDNFVRKAEAGADVAITQYFYSNAAYYHFVQEVRSRGVVIPIVAGLMPAAPYEQVLRFSEKCGADVPLWIRKRMEGYQDDPQSQLDFAVEQAVQQAQELIKNGAPGLHIYTLNRGEATFRVCEHLLQKQTDFGLSWRDAAYG